MRAQAEESGQRGIGAGVPSRMARGRQREASRWQEAGEVPSLVYKVTKTFCTKSCISKDSCHYTHMVCRLETESLKHASKLDMHA